MRCVICRNKSAKACDQCKSTHYCSKECQKLDWPIHKALCRSMAQMSPRPSEQHKLAFFFPESEPLPQLVWIKVTQKEECICKDKFCILASTWHLKSYLGDKPSLRGLDNKAFAREIGKTICVLSDDIQINPRNGASSNSRKLRLSGLDDMSHSVTPTSLSNLAKDVKMIMRGPIVVQAHERVEDPEVGWCFAITDVKLSDLTLVIDHARASPWVQRQETTIEDSGDENDSEDDDEWPSNIEVLEYGCGGEVIFRPR